MNRGVNPNHLRPLANGLEHHVLEWLPRPIEGGEMAGTAVLVHGFMDAAGTWDLVADPLTAAGFRVLALDMRGFGDGARLPPGGYYHFPDYVFDLAELVDALVEGPMFLVGHSMGGTICSYYAGAMPGRVTKLALLEGMGPPDNPFSVAPDRVTGWIQGVRLLRARGGGEKRMSRDEALRRLRTNHGGVDPEILKTRVDHLVREVESGSLVWKADPLHRTISPIPYYASAYAEFAKRISCPVLFVGGGKDGMHTPDEEARLAAFPRLTHVEIEGGGHMMHWTKASELARVLIDFWGHPVA